MPTGPALAAIPTRPLGNHVVGVADLKVLAGPGVLSTHGLGSCVAVAAFDPRTRCGALLHVLLPNGAVDPGRARTQPATFADSGVRALRDALLGLGVDPRFCQFKVAGGANLLSGGIFDIGHRNTLAVRRALNQLRLPIVAQDVGGGIPRTLRLELPSGRVTVQRPDTGEVQL